MFKTYFVFNYNDYTIGIIVLFQYKIDHVNNKYIIIFYKLQKILKVNCMLKNINRSYIII